MGAGKFVVGGNWKCNGTLASIETLTKGVAASVDAELAKKVEVIVGVPFIYIPKVQQILAGEANGANILVSAENAWTKSGAYTGEVHVGMLVDCQVPYVILGHSERRQIFHESNEQVAEKVKVAIDAGLKVIACIGETEAQRIANQTEEVVAAQLKAINNAISKEAWKNIILAYEPVWAIGTGKTATPDQAQEVHQYIRKWMTENISKEVAEATRIQYGGSVNPANCNELAKKADIDGFLVGGASLDAAKFKTIINSVSEKL
uniref:Triosephosphate Isomerase n=1 Tax=Entamoeba histolytica TaxID=5759 RepID=UPI000011256F|nr:Chain A, Triosephosphate Isomerase [Entamoeba histolytica]1M6J_B Chain B, Triosephosphate Isomerase [Entamoeba histolytica]